MSWMDTLDLVEQDGLTSYWMDTLPSQTPQPSPQMMYEMNFMYEQDECTG